MNEHSTYCFASAEGKFALFVEAFARGWLAALLDFPRLGSPDGAQAEIEALVLLPQVCCIPTEEAYEAWYARAWSVGYSDASTLSEHEITMVLVALPLKSRPIDDALAFIKETFATEGRAALNDLYARMTSTLIN